MKVSKIELMFRLWLLRQKPDDAAVFAEFRHLTEQQRQALYKYNVNREVSQDVDASLYDAEYNNM